MTTIDSQPLAMNSSKIIENTIVAPKNDNITNKPKMNVNQKSLGIYHQALLTRRITLSISSVGSNVRQILEDYVNKTVCGLCGPEGYIAPNSAKIMNYSSPVLKADNVVFETTFECLVCNPVEGMVINAVAKNVTKAGIRAEVGDTSDESVSSPMVIFVSRDHHAQSKSFNDVNINDEIQVRIIGVRFVLNDKYISAIAQLVDKPKHNADKNIKKKPKLVIKN